jgi:cytochrome c
MRSVLSVVAAAVALAGGISVGFAQSGADLVKAKGCMGCHDTDKKKVGPSFKDIAAKGKGKEAGMVAKLKDGKGHAKANASEAEIKAMVQHIVSGK